MFADNKVLAGGGNTGPFINRRFIFVHCLREISDDTNTIVYNKQAQNMVIYLENMVVYVMLSRYFGDLHGSIFYNRRPSAAL